MPFELGRPFGPPNQPEFQMDVLRSLLRLFEAPSGPVLEDYPHDAPVSAETVDEPWSCILPLPPLPDSSDGAESTRQRLLREASLLRPWYEEARRSHGRTVMGVSGLGADDIEAIVEFLVGFAFDAEPPPPAGAKTQMPLLLRHLTDDLKAYYFEAASAQPGRTALPVELNRWLFVETTFGDLLYRIRERALARGETDESLRSVSFGLVPTAFVKRPG